MAVTGNDIAASWFDAWWSRGTGKCRHLQRLAGVADEGIRKSHVSDSVVWKVQDGLIQTSTKDSAG
jgi:hypothetical protein